MNKNILTICLLFLIPTLSYADYTICKLGDDNSFSIKAIAWNNETKEAKITDFVGDTYKGLVSLTREHSEYGNKINIFITYKKPYYGQNASEFIIYPIAKNSYKIIGVAYVIKNNKKHLSMSLANTAATCLSM